MNKDTWLYCRGCAKHNDCENRMSYVPCKILEELDEKGYMSNERALKILQESTKKFSDVLKKRYCISDDVKDKIEKAKIEDNKRQCDIKCEFANTCKHKGNPSPELCYEHYYSDEIKDKVKKEQIEDIKEIKFSHKAQCHECYEECERASRCSNAGYLLKHSRDCAFFIKKGTGNTNTPDDIKTLQNGHRTGVQNECSGVKYDDNKPRLAEMFIDFCIPMEELCKVWTFGANKYEKSNWKKLDNAIDRYTNAMLRHLIAEEKETYDTESTYLHAAHIAFNALARLHFIKLKGQKND